MATPYSVPDLSSSIAAIQLINPKKTAYAQTNAQYNPQINGLARAIMALKANTKSNQKDISNWYGHVADMYQQAAAADQAYSDQETGDLNHTLAGLASNLGGDVGARTGNLGAILAKEFAGENSAQHHYLTSMRPIIGLQGAEAHVGEQKLGQQYNSILQGKLADTRSAKGNAFAEALQNAIQTRDQEAVARLNAQATAALLPSQIDQAGAATTAANLANEKTQQDIDQAAQLAPIALQQAKSSLRATQKAANAKTPTGFDLSNTSDLKAVSGALRQAMGLGARGSFSYDPEIAYKNELSLLQQTGLDKNPRAIQLAKAIAAEAVNTAHALRQWGQFTVGPDGSIVFNKARSRFAKPKK